MSPHGEGETKIAGVEGIYDTLKCLHDLYCQRNLNRIAQVSMISFFKSLLIAVCDKLIVQKHTL